MAEFTNMVTNPAKLTQGAASDPANRSACCLGLRHKPEPKLKVVLPGRGPDVAMKQLPPLTERHSGRSARKHAEVGRSQQYSPHPRVGGQSGERNTEGHKSSIVYRA